jgi:hypothetical protein
LEIRTSWSASSRRVSSALSAEQMLATRNILVKTDMLVRSEFRATS